MTTLTAGSTANFSLSGRQVLTLTAESNTTGTLKRTQYIDGQSSKTDVLGPPATNRTYGPYGHETDIEITCTYGSFEYDVTGTSLVTAETDPVTGGSKKLTANNRDVLADRGVDQWADTGGTIMVDWADGSIGTPTAGWTVEKDTTRTYAGKTALKITATAGAADTLTCDITVPTTYLGGAKRICFAIDPGDSYITGDTANPIQLWLYYSGPTTHRPIMMVAANHAVGEWFDAGPAFDQDASGTGHITGTAQWAKVATEEFTVVRIVMTKRAGQAISVPAYIGPIYTDPVRSTKATLTLFMDGQYSGQYKYARQILQAYGLRASLAVVFPWLASPSGTMTEAQLLKMCALGHELICHTGTAGDYGWDNVTKYPDGQEYDLVKADLNAAWTKMGTMGQTSGIGYAVVGFTNGLANTQTYARRQNISNALRDAGVLACRQLGAYQGSYYGNGSETQTVVTQSRMVTSADATATLTGIIDQIIARGGWSGLTFHDILLSGATGNNYNVADFETVMDYIAGKVAAGTLRVMPFSEAMQMMSVVPRPQ